MTTRLLPNTVTHRSQKKRASLPITGRHLGWNEVRFISVREFVHNAPAVISLEISRLTGVLSKLEPGSDSYTHIVTARHRLATISEHIGTTTGDHLDTRIFELMEAAILGISMETVSVAGDFNDEERIKEISEDLEYAANRLDYILAQMRRLA